VVRPERLELPAYWFEASRSIQLSYGRTRRVFSVVYDVRLALGDSPSKMRVVTAACASDLEVSSGQYC